MKSICYNKKILAIGCSVVLLLSFLSCIGYGIHSTSKKHFLWRISNSSNTIYLLGSIEVGKNMFPLADVIEKAFKESDYLVVETESYALTEKAQIKLMKMMAYSGTDNLKIYLSEELYNRLDKRLRKMGYYIHAFDRLKPITVVYLLRYLPLVKNGFQQENIELYFRKKATNKKVIGLKSIMYLYKMEFNVSPDEEKLFLKSVLDYYDKGGNPVSDSKKLFKYWQRGNLKDFERLFYRMYVENNRRHTKYYGKINNYKSAILRKIKGFLKNGKGKKYFVVIDSEYLIGEDGILALLKKDGYKVVQL